MTDTKAVEKHFSFSKEEMAHLEPVYAVFQAINTGLQHYIITQVYPRIGVTADKMSRYDIPKGTLTILEPAVENKAVTESPLAPPTGTPAQEAKGTPEANDTKKAEEPLAKLG